MLHKFDSRPFALGLVTLIASGCAAGMANQPHGRAAGEWSVTLPTAASYSQGLAYGKGGSPLPDAWVDLDDVTQPMLADARPAKLSSDDMKKKAARKHRADESQPASNVPAQAPVTPVAPPATRTERSELAMAETTQPVTADTSVLSRYESRQSQSQEQQKFAGGDAIVIGASTLVVVLLVVLLLVLLL